MRHDTRPTYKTSTEYVDSDIRGRTFSMRLHCLLALLLLLLLIPSIQAKSSPIPTFTNYTHTIEVQKNISDLWWTVDETNQTITFELHVNTLGWIALGISPGRSASVLQRR